VGRTLVIAEPGACHEGHWVDMLRLLGVAHRAGADVFKPQYVSNPTKMCERRHIWADHPKRAYYEQAYGWNSYPLEWLQLLAALCKDYGMQLACTSFLPEDVSTVDPFVSIHKIASFEAEDQELRAVARGSGKMMLVSTGMSPSLVGNVGHMSLLHCTSAYPAPLQDMNLTVLRDEAWGNDAGCKSPFIGLSDHSRHVLTGAVAVGAGATVIEAHIRLEDTSSDNPDYAAAFSPSEFKEYVANIRLAEQMMGDGIKRVQPSEEWALPYRVES
jgi:N,N'-diacetyllegionaminate synthase